MITDSILTSVKKMLGIEKDYEHFDPELIMHINSVFATLAQLGVGPSKAFSISSDDQTWSEFCTDKNFQNIKTYMYLRLRLIWDPPSNSFAVNSFESQIKELEWRMNVQAESGTGDDGKTPKERITIVIERDNCKHDHGHHKPKPPPYRPKPDPGDDGEDKPGSDEDPGNTTPSETKDTFVKPKDGMLPEVGEVNKIYLIPNGGDDPNLYDEYYWDPDRKTFELVGSNPVKLKEMTSGELLDKWNSVMAEKGLL